MMSFFSENRTPVLVVFLLVAFLLLLSFQVRVPDAGVRLHSTLLAICSPVARSSAGVVDGFGSVWRNYLYLQDLSRENRALRRRLVHFQVENQLLREADREGERLRGLLALQDRVARPTLAARVISLEVEGPFRVAVLNRGRGSGLRVNDGVITPEGVVGRITAASGRMSKVQFITDPSSGAAAVVARTRVQGMVVGRGDNRVEMQYVSALADVETGDVVTSSGLDGIYPGGFMVGTVTRVGDGEGLQKRIEITTAVDFRTLEEVLVLLAGPAEDEHEEDGS